MQMAWKKVCEQIHHFSVSNVSCVFMFFHSPLDTCPLIEQN